MRWTITRRRSPGFLTWLAAHWKGSTIAIVLSLIILFFSPSIPLIVLFLLFPGFVVSTVLAVSSQSMGLASPSISFIQFFSFLGFFMNLVLYLLLGAFLEYYFRERKRYHYWKQWKK